MKQTITQKSTSLTIESLGARKLLTIDGEKILTKVTRGDGKVGSTHPCSPIFNPDYNNLYGLNQHGDMRNTEVGVTKANENTLEILHRVNEARYPEGMLVEQICTLENNVFTLRTIHTNTGNERAAVLTGEHCYFDAPQSYKGTKINNQDITALIEDNKDGVAIKLNSTNRIEIPGKSIITLKQEGFEYAMLWVGSTPDMKSKDQDYICIEPVEADPTKKWFGTEESFVAPNQSRSASFSLRC